jgi:hypothetical protein
MPCDLTPFPKPDRRVGETTEANRSANVQVPQRRDLVRFGCWCGLLFALSLAATLSIVHEAVSHPSVQLSHHYLVVWAAGTAGSLLAASLLGGLLVFRRETPWSVAGLWPLLAGPAVAVGYFFGVSGQMDAGSALCDARVGGSCDAAWGFGAIVIAVVAGAALGTLFSVAFALKRFIRRTTA